MIKSAYNCLMQEKSKKEKANLQSENKNGKGWK